MIRISKSSFFRAVVVCLGVLAVFSCSKEKDMRASVVENYGEPDEKVKGGAGAYQYEHYVYQNKNINRVYVFYKSAPGCGGSGQWYIEYVYAAEYWGYELYEPPTIIHAPIVNAPVGKPINITAEITDDVQVTKADVFYRTTGTADSTAVAMSVSETVYSATLPASSITAAGIEYYIEAEDNAEHKTRLPTKGYFQVIVIAGKAVVIGKTETSVPMGISNISLEPGVPSGGNSSLGP
ncbi:hypothetical protein ACFL47_09785 [Candidatus Latescibacterota bacterium]